MRVAVLLFISVIFFISIARAESGKAVDIGHNLTPTTKTVAAGVWTAGNYALGYGISDSLFIVTSPWIWVNYNTINLHLKWSSAQIGRSRFGIFASYFESLRWAFVGDAPYFWKSASTNLLYTYSWSPQVETNFSLRASYFWNDDRPYSIRMDMGDNAIRGQLDLTSLTRIRIAESDFSLGLELGTVGMNYLYPYMHVGASVLYTWNSWLAQFGFSYTIQWREWRESKGLRPGRIDTRVRQSSSDGQFYYYPYETALHPEMQLQYFF